METGEIEGSLIVSFKKCLANFDKRFIENQKSRIKHADDPEKYASSETELFVSLNEIQSALVDPQIIPILIERKSSLSNLLSLLAHENTDISAKVVKIMIDCVDDDSNKLSKELINLNLIDLLISNAKRLDINNGPEEECVIDTLQVIQTILEQDPASISKSYRDIIEWEISQLKIGTGYSRSKLEFADQLTILVSSSNKSKKYLSELGGVDVLLQIIAKYRKTSPAGGESEYLAQIFNCLCVTVLDCDEARESFLEEEGVDLVVLILLERDDAVKRSNIKMSTLQLFSYVVSTDKNEDPIVTKCCERFVEASGLRVIFPIFNNPHLVLNRRLLRSEVRPFLAAVEEHTSSIIMAMLKYTQNEECIQRILIKFAETNFLKFERALSLHDKYYKSVQLLEKDETDVKTSLAFNNLRSIDYIILLVVYLSQHFETYDHINGETFSNYLRKTFKTKPHLRHQITNEVNEYMDEIQNNPGEVKSLSFLLEKFHATFDATD